VYSIYNIYLQTSFIDNDLTFFIDSNTEYTKENIEFELLKMLIDHINNRDFYLFVTLHNDYTQKPFIQLSCDTYDITRYQNLLVQFITDEILPECTRKFNLKTMIRKKLQNDLYKTRAFISWYKANPDQDKDMSTFDIFYHRIIGN